MLILLPALSVSLIPLWLVSPSLIILLCFRLFSLCMIVSYCALARGHPYPFPLVVSFHISNAVMCPSIAYACTQSKNCRWWHTPSWFATHKHKEEKNNLRHQLGDICLWSQHLCITVKDIHWKWSFLCYYGCFLFCFVFNFGDANNRHPTNFSTSTSTVLQSQWNKPVPFRYKYFWRIHQPTSLFRHACFCISCRLCPATHEPCQTQFVKCAQACNGCVHTNQKDRIFRASSVKTFLVPSPFLCLCQLFRFVCFSLLWLINCPLCI